MEHRFIIVHHSFTKDGGVNDWEAIRRYHKEEKGWDDIGYHLGIEQVAGKMVLQVGRDLNTPGAHTKELGMNGESIGLCIVGNYDILPPPLELLGFAADILRTLVNNFDIAPENILGHREVGLLAGFDWLKGEYKTCPGKMFPMEGLRQRTKHRLFGDFPTPVGWKG